MKIAVLGYSGSGKSTLARRLGEYFQVPVLHLDVVNFLPGWRERDGEEGRAMVRAFMEGDGWVIDGNYRRLLEAERLAGADWIIFMDFPRRVCSHRAFAGTLPFGGGYGTASRKAARKSSIGPLPNGFWWMAGNGRCGRTIAPSVKSMRRRPASADPQRMSDACGKP